MTREDNQPRYHPHKRQGIKPEPLKAPPHTPLVPKSELLKVARRRRNVPAIDPTVPRAPHQLNKHTGSRGNQAWHDQQNKGGFQMGDRDAGFQMGNVSNPFVMGGNRSVSSSRHLRRRNRRRKRRGSDLPFEA